MTGPTSRCSQSAGKGSRLWLSFLLGAIDDGEVLSGSLPLSKMKLVQAWIEIHKEDLMADWKLAVAGEPVFKIDPLK